MHQLLACRRRSIDNSATRDARTQLAVCQPPYYQKLLMSSDTRILNLSRNTRLKLHQAESRIKAGVMIWVEIGVSVRESTIAEVMQARMHQRSLHDGLSAVELPGLIWEPPISGKAKQRESWAILRETAEFYREATA